MVIAIIVVLSLLFILMLWSVVLYQKDKNVVGSHCEISEKPKLQLDVPIMEATIEDIADRVASENLSEEELLALVSIVGKKHKFPSDASIKDVEPYLRFVSQFCMNENAHGQTIVKMSNTLKAINPGYKLQIERLEKAAVKERDQKDSQAKIEELANELA